MFHSAILKLTGWYLLILMSISILFSIAVYGGATGEIGHRLSNLQNRFEQPTTDGTPPTPDNDPYSAYRDTQRKIANHNIMMELIYVNILIVFCGGALSYLLAKRTLRDIEAAHVAQSRFTSDASHELRTPLAAMRAELEVSLNDPKLSKDDMRDLLKSNLEEVDKLTTLSKTLLQLSKLEHATLELEPVNLGILAAEVVQRYDKNAKRIDLKLPKAAIIINANQSSIEELLTILVDNALKYSPSNSKITANFRLQGRNAQFSITNEGDGIPTDKLPHVFDRFYRANESRTDGGSGLGLALAKEIVALHKGELSVTSAQSSDTTFSFVLPLMRKAQA